MCRWFEIVPNSNKNIYPETRIYIEYRIISRGRFSEVPSARFRSRDGKSEKGLGRDIDGDDDQSKQRWHPVYKEPSAPRSGWHLLMRIPDVLLSEPRCEPTHMILSCTCLGRRDILWLTARELPRKKISFKRYVYTRIHCQDQWPHQLVAKKFTVTLENFCIETFCGNEQVYG